MSRLLIDEHPLQVLPTLAVAIGLNESMFIQQLHFWLGIARKSGSGRIHNGQVWSYKTFEEWQTENFPFWGISTIKRLVDKLEKSGLILVEKLDQHKRVQTNFYTINYAKLNELCRELKGEIEAGKDVSATVSERPIGECQSDTMESVKTACPSVSERHDLIKRTETTTETTAERARTPRATRLAPDWTLPDDWLNWALAEQPSWQPADVLRIADQFRDYWLAKGGADARKVDWGATWRNWVRRERQPPARTTNVRPPTARPSAYEQGMAAAERAKAMIFGDAHEAC